MLRPLIVAVSTLAIACAGSQAEKNAVSDPIDEDDDNGSVVDDKPRDEPKPRRKPRKRKLARATLKPYKGAKLKSATVDLSERDEEIRLKAEVRGLKPGRYKLTVHTGSRCGKSAKNAGPVWEEMESIVLTVDEESETMLKPKRVTGALDGDLDVLGRLFVLREEGKRGKVLGCGVIERVRADD